jgi:hypothetical protein
MVKSAPTSTAGLTQDDGGGHTGWVTGAGPVTWDSSRAAWLRQARSQLRGADPVLARLVDDRPAFPATRRTLASVEATRRADTPPRTFTRPGTR